MRVFLDQGVPHGIRRYLKDQHEAVTAIFQGWDQRENGDLLKAAEDAGFDVMISTDKVYLTYEHRLAKRRIALGTGNWPNIQRHLPEIAAEVEAAQPGKFSFVEMLLPPRLPYRK